MKQILTIGSIASIMAMATLSVNAANLLANGNFNTGDFSGWYTYAADGTMANTINTTLTYDSTPNAQMVSGDLTYRDAIGQAPVVIGANLPYTISFVYDASAVPTTAGGNFAISVTYYSDLAGSVYNGFEFPTGVLTTSGAWAPYSGNFTTPAGTQSLKLEFELYAPVTVQLDNISLAPVPEPSSLMLLGGAGLSLLALRRRRT